MNVTVLDENNKVIEISMDELVLWIRKHGAPNKVVAHTEVFVGVSVSTVFISGAGAQVDSPFYFPFEIAIIDDNGVEPDRRCKTWDDALKSHDEVVEAVRRRHLDEPKVLD